MQEEKQETRQPLFEPGQRKFSAENEAQYVSDLEIFSETAKGLSEIPFGEDIWEYIGNQLFKLTSPSPVIVNAIDETTNCLQVKTFFGLDEYIDPAVSLLGKNPLEFSFPVTSEAWGGLMNHRLVQVEGQVNALACGLLSPDESSALQEMVGISDAYAMGFAWHGKLYGSVTILVKKPHILRNPWLIQALIHLASVTIQRRKLEKAREEAMNTLEARIAERTRDLTRSNELLRTEIAERSRAEVALRKSQRTAVTLLDAANEAAGLITPDGTILALNAVMARRFGGTAKEFINTCIFDYYPPELVEMKRNHIREVCQSRQTGNYKEERNGSILDNTVYPIFNDRGEIDRLAIYSRDVTESIRLQRMLQQNNERLDEQNEQLLLQKQQLTEKSRELEAASKSKSEFLSSMSHELRTPLNAIIGFSELMMDGIAGEVNDEQRQCLGDIHNSGQQLLEIINDVLDLSKIEAGKMEIKIEDFEFDEVLEEVVDTIQPLLKSGELNFSHPAFGSVGRTHADRAKLRQVFLNLLSNAIKFTPEQGTIAVEVQKSNGWYSVSVRDTGTGIRREALTDIFNAFTQLRDETGREHKGTGLGLALSRKFVETWGGEITVTSEYGKGSCFTFTVPVASEHNNPATPDFVAEQKIPYQLQRDGRIVLVIDDDSRARHLVKSWLEPEGYSIVEATGGNDGLRKAEQLLPSLIVLDILMPDKDGWQVLRELKQSERTREIPVVISSVLEQQNEAIELGAAECFVKPLHRDQLLKKLMALNLPKDACILVVDDNPVDQRLVLSTLEAEGLKVCSATNGEQGIEMAKTSSPSLIVLDLLMPGMSGFETLEQLRKDECTRDIPVLVLTNKDLTNEESQMLNRNSVAIMRKSSFSRTDFIRVVAQAASHFPGKEEKTA